jgi:hypothetical protein
MKGSLSTHAQTENRNRAFFKSQLTAKQWRRTMLTAQRRRNTSEFDGDDPQGSNRTQPQALFDRRGVAVAFTKEQPGLMVFRHGWTLCRC